MSKGSLNYTTTIEAAKTASECVARLAEHGASAIGITYANKRPTGLTFKIETIHGERQFSLPVNTDGTFKALLKANRRGDIAPRYSTSEHGSAPAVVGRCTRHTSFGMQRLRWTAALIGANGLCMPAPRITRDSITELEDAVRAHLAEKGPWWHVGR